MEYISVVISIIALLLSAFTFYWVQLRVKHELHLVRIDNVFDFDSSNFALVNNGTRDILLTSIQGWFKFPRNGNSVHPTQNVILLDGASMLLQAGKALHCRIEFSERLPEEDFIQGHVLENSKPIIFQLPLEIRVTWVDIAAKSHEGAACIAKYGLSLEGSQHFSPLKAKHNLYKSNNK